MKSPNLKLIAGRSNQQLASSISDYLEIPLSEVTLKEFADGETYVRIDEDVRGDDVFVIQSTDSNRSIVELLLLIDALKRASARNIIAVIPYYGYARQDRKSEPREPIASKLFANMLTTAGATRVLTLDIHAPQIQGFFDVVLDDLWAFPLFSSYFKKKELHDPIIVSPDAGGIKRAVHLGKQLDTSVAFIDKRREKHNSVASMTIVGDVKDKDVILYDDIIDTAGTICKAAQMCKDEGARNVYICCTHPIFSKDAVDKLSALDTTEIITTDTIARENLKGISVISTSRLLGQAIQNIFENKSVSILKKEVD